MGSTETVIITVLYAIAMLVALVGNLFLIYIVWKKPKVRSLTSFMFVNMAVADLLLTLVMMPWSIAHHYTKAGWLIRGTFGDITCRGVIFTAYATVMASILCLTFIAVDRYYAVFYPFRPSVWFRRAKILTPLIWVLSMALMSIISPVTYHLRFPSSDCVINFDIWPGEQVAAIRGVYLYVITITYLIPLSAITVLYTKIAHKLWFHQAPGHLLFPNQRRREVEKRKVIRSLIIIVIVFALCWLPSQAYHIFLVVTVWDVEHPVIAMYLCFWFGHANSAINPWLFIFFNRKMTVAIKIRRFNAEKMASKKKTKTDKFRVKKETAV